jgi:NAD(P)-dependent dehydrogenase (short-subunit alcohol dehydrogenase family)
MKETLRKKSTKTGSGSEFDVASQLDVTSQSSESVSPNPWASEASPSLNGEAISRQISKSSKSPDTVSPIRSIMSTATREETETSPPRAKQLEVPSVNGDAANDENKPTRRRKTVTKTPHTFELEADLNPLKPKESLPVTESPASEAPLVTPKKKKRVSVSQAPPSDSTTTSPALNSVASFSQTATPMTSPRIPSNSAPSAMPAQPSTPSVAISPASPKQVSSPTAAPVNPFVTRTKKSQSLSNVPQVFTSNPCRFVPPALPKESFHGKVVVLTHGASQVGQALIRHLHAAGCRVLFGDTNPDQARRFISSLGPPHVVHFNKCDMTRYSDMLDLFKLAVTMYGRVDHAIFGVGEDGGQASTVGGGERGWFGDRPGVNKTAKMAYDEVATEPAGLGDILTASVRFARIAMAYLKYSPKAKANKKIINPYSTPQPEPPSTAGTNDRSLTFITSIAAFKETPQLPIYQIAQHSILGLVRSLRTSVDPDPDRDGVRINAVVTNVMVPRAVAQAGGRSMSVQLPPDKPEDIARVVIGVVATNSSTPDINGTDGSNGAGITSGGGIWYEKGFERGMREKYLHGRVIYGVGTDCWDIQEGLDRSEAVWLGQRPAEALTRNLAGVNLNSSGGQSSWILDMI